MQPSQMRDLGREKRLKTPVLAKMVEYADSGDFPEPGHKQPYPQDYEDSKARNCGLYDTEGSKILRQNVANGHSSKADEQMPLTYCFVWAQAVTKKVVFVI